MNFINIGLRGGKSVKHLSDAEHFRVSSYGYAVSSSETFTGRHSIFIPISTLKNVFKTAQSSLAEHMNEGRLLNKEDGCLFLFGKNLICDGWELRELFEKGEHFFSFDQLEHWLTPEDLARLFDVIREALTHSKFKWSEMQFLTDRDYTRLSGEKHEAAEYCMERAKVWEDAYVLAHRKEWQYAYTEEHKRQWHDDFVLSEMEILQELRQQKKQCVSS